MGKEVRDSPAKLALKDPTRSIGEPRSAGDLSDVHLAAISVFVRRFESAARRRGRSGRGSGEHFTLGAPAGGVRDGGGGLKIIREPAAHRSYLSASKESRPWRRFVGFVDEKCAGPPRKNPRCTSGLTYHYLSCDQYRIPLQPARHHAPTDQRHALADPEGERQIAQHAHDLADLGGGARPATNVVALARSRRGATPRLSGASCRIICSSSRGL